MFLPFLITPTRSIIVLLLVQLIGIKEFTEMNPLAITQKTYIEKSNPELNEPLVNLIREDFSVALVDAQGEHFQPEPNGDTDAVVTHPRTKIADGRHDWLVQKKKPFQIPVEKLKVTPVHVLAYREGEYLNNGFPADILEVTQKKTKYFLYLSKGKYEIVVKNKAYKVINIFKIEIK